MASKTPVLTTTLRPKTLLVCAYSPHDRLITPEYYQEEFLNLIKTLGIDYDASIMIKLRYIDSNLFFTKGKLEELVAFCSNEGFEEIIFSEILTPLQEKNLVDILHAEIFDREKIILSIFQKSAHSGEGKVQVEMAEIAYLKTRLIGRGKDYSQQAGFIGGRGPGETVKEMIKRHFAEKIRQAEKRLETLKKARNLQRQKRLETNIPLVSIVGYTNAGKSSLLNRLTKSNVLAEDKLFATLDTTTRELFLGTNAQQILISDTVGFISNLPPNLIAAFQSTLEELKYAVLLLHIIDCSNPSWQAQIRIVNQTLNNLAVDKPVIHVFNKIDKIAEEDREAFEKQLEGYQPYVTISTKSKEGVAPLVKLLQFHFSKTDKKHVSQDSD